LIGFTTTTTFDKTIDAYLSDKRTIVNQGGTSSGKSWAIMQLLFLVAYRSDEPLIISVVSYALPHLRLGVMRDFDNILISAGIVPDTIKNKTDHYYKIGKSTIEFFGTDNLAKVHGPRRDILFVNEANHIKYDIYTQLTVRTKSKIFIDFNPVSEFWVHDELMPSGNCAFIKTTYLDNELLDSSIIKEIESRRNNKNWWRVYGLGEIGQLEGVIFANWRYDEFDKTLPYAFGLDFGFHPDPDAMAKWAINRKHKKIYADECFYKYEQTPGELKNSVSDHANRNDLIIADSADPRLIRELSTEFNIRGISKRGTVAEWLRIMQDYEIIITEDSHNLAKELNNYVWNDKKAGIPIDGWDHLISGGRYVLMDQHQKARMMRRAN